MEDQKRIAEKLDQARRLVSDARVIGALSQEDGLYHKSLLVGALENHCGVLAAHLS